MLNSDQIKKKKKILSSHHLKSIGARTPIKLYT